MDNRFVRRFSLVGLIAIFLLGLFLSFIASFYIRDRIINVTGNINAYLLENTIVTQINPQKLVDSNQKDNSEVNRFLENVAQAKNIKIIKVWDTQGKIVHSTMSELNGKKFPIEPELKEALAGRVHYDITNLGKRDNALENKSYNELYEIYIPLRSKTNHQVIGVFEVYWGTKELAATFTDIFRFVLGIMIIGFVATYLGTYWILRKMLCIIKEKDLSIGNLTKRLEDTKMQRAYIGTIQSLLTALDAKDKYTAGHSVRVADYAIQIARRLGMDDEKIKLIEEASLFHDIGKIAISERILNKASMLNEDEFEKVKQHSVIGEQIVQASGVLEKMSHIIRCHHERIDGHGYPDGLTGDEIPLEAQILAVADTYDALTSNRPYKKAITVEKALKVMREVQGSQLNPDLVELLIEIIKKENKIKANL